MSGLAEINTWISGQLSSADGSLLTYLWLFAGGLVASLLPCVYPLYPVTISVLRARGSASRWVHPLLYYLGLVMIYLVFGAFAGFGGGFLNELMQYSVTNLVIGGIFLVLALAVVDYLHLPIFKSRGTDPGDGATGTVLMGMSAGLLSSACVGPVVVGILLTIAASSDGAPAVAAIQGAVSMLAFGLGLGLPLLMIGLFGIQLPKGGAWMPVIQWVLALLILWFSYLYLEKGLLVLGLDTAQVSLSMGGLALVLLALYFWQDPIVSRQQRIQRSLLATAAIIGVTLLLRGMLPAPITQIANLDGEQASVASLLIEEKHGLTWHLDRDVAYEMAAQTGRNVFIDFYAHWCANCKEFVKLTGTDATLNAALQNAVLLKVYDTSPEFDVYAADLRFPELNVGLPFFVITDAKGHLLFKTTDYLQTEDMALFL